MRTLRTQRQAGPSARRRKTATLSQIKGRKSEDVMTERDVTDREKALAQLMYDAIVKIGKDGGYSNREAFHALVTVVVGIVRNNDNPHGLAQSVCRTLQSNFPAVH